MKVHLNASGLLLGAVFLAFSLKPSLLPRPPLLQGVLSGLSFAAGYGLGVAWIALWRYLQLPAPAARVARVLRRLGFAICSLLVAASLWQAADWQRSVHALMGTAGPAGGYPVLLVVIAALTFILVLGIGASFPGPPGGCRTGWSTTRRRGLRRFWPCLSQSSCSGRPSTAYCSASCCRLQTALSSSSTR